MDPLGRDAHVERDERRLRRQTSDPRVDAVAGNVTIDAWREVCRFVKSRAPILLALMVSSCMLGAVQSGSFRPTFRPVGCPVEITSIVLINVSCGRLTVLAHHAAPDQGTLDLFVAE